MHYHRRRTYAPKLELQLTGSTFRKDDLFLEITAAIKNLGASRHTVQREGTTCEIFAISRDLSETSLGLVSIFASNRQVEPGESINNLIQYKVGLPSDSIIWTRADLRVIWKKLKWNMSCLVRIE